MMKITNNNFYLEHSTHYDVLSDYVNTNHRQVPLEKTDPEILVDVELDDCLLSNNGDFFVPVAYTVAYQGSNDTDDLTETIPSYVGVPNLTKLEIENLVAEVEQPEINDPARNI